jgi:peptidoglycan hydrolase-like protein with peptidoglycan-binding domain
MRTHFTHEAEPFEAYTDFELEFEINRSSRDYIKWVQSSLNRIIGARLVVDGISGAQTRAAVQTFQRQRGLTADGIVGPATGRGRRCAFVRNTRHWPVFLCD